MPKVGDFSSWVVSVIHILFGNLAWLCVWNVIASWQYLARYSNGGK